MVIAIQRDAVDLKHVLSILIKTTSVIFLLVMFPSFILTFSYNSCVTFQGTYPAFDFFGSQLEFVLLALPLINNRFYDKSKYWLYHTLVSGVIGIIQFIAFIIHIYGLSTNGKGLKQFDTFTVFEVENGSIVDEIEANCFKVTYGAIYYSIVANLIAAIVIEMQCWFAAQYYCVLSNKNSFLCFKLNINE
eukprot:209971_1